MDGGVQRTHGAGAAVAHAIRDGDQPPEDTADNITITTLLLHGGDNVLLMTIGRLSVIQSTGNYCQAILNQLINKLQPLKLNYLQIVPIILYCKLNIFIYGWEHGTIFRHLIN